ncbi:hypothetical protein HC251_00180 [Iamia sp. SCSIO 61187]|uniref:hypothetical protein n=1 Tax=Iamia sp. SCSIO 61187 TaxID=2722752 RepID=UPI001C626D89|nr:hypothetical protein [Iamia sp. SCSIO 61187]QYG91002.1 hypothetical protein HC251_00180 [Iamia sp. SCSIO 61187]
MRFVMVGGQAAAAHGALRLTRDLDVCVEWTPENLDRVGEVLVELDAGLRVDGLSQGFVPPHRDGDFLAPMELSTWRTVLGDLDVLRGLPSPDGEVRYADLEERAVTLTIDGHAVRVAALDDVITSKETVDRPSDREALPELRRLAQRRRIPRADGRDLEPPGL